MNEVAIAALAALPGFVTALIAIYQARRKAKQDEVTLLRQMVDRASERENELGEEIKELRVKNRALTQQIGQLEQNINFERRSRALLTQRVDELVAENHKLHQYIGELRERVRKAGAVHPEAVAMMHQVPAQFGNLLELAREECNQQKIVDEIERLSSYVQSIVLIATGPNGD